MNFLFLFAKGFSGIHGRQTCTETNQDTNDQKKELRT